MTPARLLLLILLGMTAINTSAQLASPVPYKDTVNHFSIDIPAGWRYGTNRSMPDLLLIAMRSSTGPDDKPSENFNLNVIKKANSSLDREYTRLIDALMSTNDFTLLEKGDTTIHELPYKWFIETHKNVDGSALHNYVFITYKAGKTYILTFVAHSKDFDKYRSLFYQVAGTFVL